jgi:small subunit ribosomal protein S28e
VIILKERKVERSKEKTDKKSSKTTVRDERFQGKVIELIGRTGARGEATQARVKILTGFDKDKIIRRNIKGPVRINDIIIMLETEMEAAPLRTGRDRR